MHLREAISRLERTRWKVFHVQGMQHDRDRALEHPADQHAGTNSSAAEVPSTEPIGLHSKTGYQRDGDGGTGCEAGYPHMPRLRRDDKV